MVKEESNDVRSTLDLEYLNNKTRVFFVIRRE